MDTVDSRSSNSNSAPHPAVDSPPWYTALAPALRRTLREGYGWRDLRDDLLAGLVVGVIALPLSMALAIASGVPPQYGLYTAIVAGAVTALCGGSPVQVTGPTAAFVVVLAPVAATYGLSGLLLATLMAGALLMLMGFARLGRLIEFVPFPVTTGFTAGIALVIATLQLRDFLGLQVDELPEHYIERVYVLGYALPTLRWPDLLIGAITLLVLLILPRFVRRMPAALVALPLAAVLAVALAQWLPEFGVETIQSKFKGIPQQPPQFVFPWDVSDPEHPPVPVTLDTLRRLMPSAVAIALLGAIESLLSAVVASGMSGKEHDPDGELIAQGMGNLVAPFFGGFAATGAIARTATNVRSGARSPIAAVFHAVFLLVGVLLAAPLLGYLPMAALAALLLVVAWNMSELRHVFHTLRVAPRGDVLVLVTCFGLTVIFDMTIAVSVGVVLAALLFMRRMAEVTGVREVARPMTGATPDLPPGVVVYEVAGPLFFGAATRAMSALRRVDRSICVVVLDLRAVPVMDATGLVNLESALGRLHQSGIYTVLAGVQAQPLGLMARAGWKHRDWMSVFRSFEHGVEVARHLAHLTHFGTSTSPQTR